MLEYEDVYEDADDVESAEEYDYRTDPDYLNEVEAEERRV